MVGPLRKIHRISLEIRAGAKRLLARSRDGAASAAALTTFGTVAQNATCVRNAKTS
jgi:hypothetical protein